MTPENGTKKEPNTKPDSISSPSSCGCSAISHHSGFSPFTDASTLSSASSIACTQIPPVLNIGNTTIILLILIHSLHPVSIIPITIQTAELPLPFSFIYGMELPSTVFTDRDPERLMLPVIFLPAIRRTEPSPTTVPSLHENPSAHRAAPFPRPIRRL